MSNTTLATYLAQHATQRSVHGPVAHTWSILPDGVHVSEQNDGRVAFRADGPDFIVRVEVAADKWRDGLRRCRHGMQGVMA